MIDNHTLQKAFELIKNSNNILVTTHARPDGDACGSMAALSTALTTAGKNVKILVLSDIPQWYKFLFQQEPIVLDKDITIPKLIAGELISPDLTIIVDTNSNNQLPGFEDFLKQNDKPVLVIDHHVTSDNLGDVELIDTTAAAAGIIVYDLFKFEDWKVTKEIATALFTAITTDTGWFKFDNTDSRTHINAAELIEAGAKPAKLYNQLYQNFSPQRFKLMTTMLNSVELHLDDKYATAQLLASDFEKTGAAYSDTENLIDECRRIASVKAVALFVEQPDGDFKCSFRSKGPIDVRKIAQKFDGGGHNMAAGAHLPGPIEKAKKLAKDAFSEQFELSEN